MKSMTCTFAVHSSLNPSFIQLLGLTCAMRVTEIARLLVADVVMPSGQLRKEVSLRAAITKGCRQRCVFLTHKLAIDAVERYIELRWAKDHGTEFDRRRFRGLCPKTAFILTHKGFGFELTTKRRLMVSGETEDHLACDSLQAHVTSLCPLPRRPPQRCDKPLWPPNVCHQAGRARP
jgi:integrase/recombinase XerD